MLKENDLSGIIDSISKNYEEIDLFYLDKEYQLPNRDTIVHIIMGLRQVMFPGYFDKERLVVYDWKRLWDNWGN